MNQSGKPYEYPNSVLRNRFGIQDAKLLTQTEATITGLRIAELDQQGLPGNFDLMYLQAIHHYIFQDIYDWAGELRTIDIGKGPGQFAHVAYLTSNATKLFGQLAQELHLQGLTLPQFAQRAAYYLGEVNALHPFREGNGRTQRMFFFFLARQNALLLDWTQVTGQEMIDASSASLLRGDNQTLEQLLLRSLSPVQP